MQPHGTDEVPLPGAPGSVCAPDGKALFGQGDEGRVELDAQPVTAALFGGKRHRAGAEERVKHDARLRGRVARTCGSQLPSRRPFLLAVYRLACPRLPALDTHPFRAGGTDGDVGQGEREDGEV